MVRIQAGSESEPNLSWDVSLAPEAQAGSGWPHSLSGRALTEHGRW